MMMVVDPLLFQGESLKLNLGILSLLHRLELVRCGHGATQRRGLGHLTERTTKELLSKHLAVSEGVCQDGRPKSSPWVRQTGQGRP